MPQVQLSDMKRLIARGVKKLLDSKLPEKICGTSLPRTVLKIIDVKDLDLPLKFTFQLLIYFLRLPPTHSVNLPLMTPHLYCCLPIFYDLPDSYLSPAP